MSCSDTYLAGAGSLFGMKCTYMDSSGSYAATVSGGNKFYLLPFTSESFNPTGDSVDSNAITGGRTRFDKTVLNKVGDGSFDTELTYENLGYLLFASTGFDSGDSDTSTLLPKFDVAIRHGGSSGIQYLASCGMVNSFAFSWANNAYVSASIDMMADSYTVADDTFTVDVATNFDDLGFPTGADALIKATGALNANTLISPEHLSVDVDTPSNASYVKLYKDSSTSYDICIKDNISAFDFTIGNNLDGAATNLDGSGRITTVPGWFTVTGNLTIQPGNDITAAQLAACDIGTSYIGSFVIKFTDGTTTYTLTLSNLRVISKTDDISGQGLVPVVIGFEAYGSTPFTWTVATIPTYYLDLPATS